MSELAAIDTMHFEGWGLGLFEATGNVKPIIVTAWDRYLSYLDRDCVNIIDYKLMLTDDRHGSEAP